MAVSSKQIIVYMKKILRQSCIFILYLIFVYWATQAFQKYLDEPTNTNINYKFGSHGKQIKPSLITACSASKTPQQKLIIEQECNLNHSISGIYLHIWIIKNILFCLSCPP